MRILEFIARIPFRVIIGANILLILAGAALTASYIYPTPQHGATNHIVGIEATSSSNNLPVAQPSVQTSNSTVVSPTNVSAPSIDVVGGESAPTPLPTIQPQPQPQPAGEQSSPTQPSPSTPCLETDYPTDSSCYPCSCFSTGRHLCPMIACRICDGPYSIDIACRL